MAYFILGPKHCIFCLDLKWTKEQDLSAPSLGLLGPRIPVTRPYKCPVDCIFPFCRVISLSLSLIAGAVRGAVSADRCGVGWQLDRAGYPQSCKKQAERAGYETSATDQARAFGEIQSSITPRRPAGRISLSTFACRRLRKPPLDQFSVSFRALQSRACAQNQFGIPSSCGLP